MSINLLKFHKIEPSITFLFLVCAKPSTKVQRRHQTRRSKFFNQFHSILPLWCSFEIKFSFFPIIFRIKVGVFIH